jgi:hypothetical protein
MTVFSSKSHIFVHLIYQIKDMNTVKPKVAKAELARGRNNISQ